MHTMNYNLVKRLKHKFIRHFMYILDSECNEVCIGFSMICISYCFIYTCLVVLFSRIPYLYLNNMILMENAHFM